MNAAPDRNVFSVVMPSRNSADLLMKYLPHNYNLIKSEAAELGMSVEVIFVFEESGDASAEIVSNIVQDDLIMSQAAVGSGYGGKCNSGVSWARGHWILILTTDVELQPGFVRPLVSRLRRGDIFSVSPMILRPLEQFKNESITRGKFRRHQIEVIRTLEGSGISEDEERNILWPCGAVFLTTKTSYQLLNGFSDEYLPGYSEDVDLGIRAWMRSLHCIYSPNAKALHWHNSTFKKQGEEYVNFLLVRNHLILNLKFLPRSEKFMFLIKRIFKALRSGNQGALKPILAAVKIWWRTNLRNKSLTMSRQDLVELLCKSK